MRAQLEGEKAFREEKDAENSRLREEKEENSRLRVKKEVEISRLREELEKQKIPVTASAFLSVDRNEVKKELQDAIRKAWAGSFQEK